jgi:peptidoglycan/LPS O-acetylase OafA/YrhL
LLVAAATANNGLFRLRLPGAKILATLAFSLYLTHKEVAHVDQLFFPWLDQESGWRAAGIYAASCLAMAALLYTYVERPFLLLRDRRLNQSQRSTPGVEARLDPAL